MVGKRHRRRHVNPPEGVIKPAPVQPHLPTVSVHVEIEAVSTPMPAQTRELAKQVQAHHDTSDDDNRTAER
jgi:hypothetical protein